MYSISGALEAVAYQIKVPFNDFASPPVREAGEDAGLFKTEQPLLQYSFHLELYLLPCHWARLL